MNDTTRIEAGQVWRHHSTGDYRVVGFGQHDSVRIARLDSMQPRDVWPDYLRRNLTLQPGVVRGSSNDPDNNT